MPISQEATKTAHWDAWSGDLDALTRLADTLDEVSADYRAEAATREQEHEYRRVLEEESPDERWRAHLEYVERELSLRRSGPARDLIDDLPPTGIVSLTLRVPAKTYGTRGSCRIEFSDKGCDLTVSGEDPTWVRGAFGTLETEVRRHVPRWSVLRSQGAWYGFSMPAIFATVAGFGYDNMDFGTAMGLTVVGFLIGTGLWVGVRTILPGFEVLRPARTGRSLRMLAAAGAIVLAIVGVVASILA